MLSQSKLHLFGNANNQHLDSESQRELNLALKQLASFNLTQDDLNTWIEKSERLYFSEDHRKTLKYLICIEQLKPRTAIDEIIGLDSIMVCTVRILYSEGLRGKHLRLWQPYESYYKSLNWHAHKYFILFVQCHCFWLKPQDAINEINQLNGDMVTILQSHFEFGLRGNHLRYWQDKIDKELDVDTAIEITRLFHPDNGKIFHQRTSEEIIEFINKLIEKDLHQDNTTKTP